MKNARTIIPVFILITGLFALIWTDTVYLPHKTSDNASDTLIIAHRGASGTAPENTLAAVQKALEAGADMIEVDIHQSADSGLVVIHDDTVDRTTDGAGLVADMTLPALRMLDAGSWFQAQYAGERIPTLIEVMRLVNGQAGLLIEIKHGDRPYPEIEARTVQLIRQENAGDWCIVQSFQDSVLHRVHAADTTVTIHKLAVGELPLIHFLFKCNTKNKESYPARTASINVNYRLVTPRLVRYVHKKGRTVYAWTVNDTEIMEKLMNRGVDGIITDFPEKALLVRENLQKESKQ